MKWKCICCNEIKELGKLQEKKKHHFGSGDMVNGFWGIICVNIVIWMER